MITSEAFVQLLKDSLGIEELIDADTPLLSSGIIDSFDLAALLTVIETEFGVAISVDEIDVDSFDSADQMKARIQGVVA